MLDIFRLMFEGNPFGIPLALFEKIQHAIEAIPPGHPAANESNNEYNHHHHHRTAGWALVPLHGKLDPRPSARQAGPSSLCPAGWTLASSKELLLPSICRALQAAWTLVQSVSGCIIILRFPLFPSR